MSFIPRLDRLRTAGSSRCCSACRSSACRSSWSSRSSTPAGSRLACALTELVLGLGIWWAFDPGQPGAAVRRRHRLDRRLRDRIPLGIDGISVLMVLLSVIMMPLVVWGSWRGIDQKQRGFYALLLALTTGMLGVFVSHRPVPVLRLLGTAADPDVLHDRHLGQQQPALRRHQVRHLHLRRLAADAGGDRLDGVDGGQGHRHVLVRATSTCSSTPRCMQPWAGWLFVAFFLAFAVKVPLFPFHTWLPDAHIEAPTAGSVDLAVILLKMGTYGFLRFAMPFFPTFALSETVGLVIVTLAVIGIVYAALVAMVQPDFKKLVAYSSVSHLGFVMLGIWARTVESVQGAMMVMVTHGLSTGALFFLIGMLYERRHTRMIADFGGLAKVVPLLAAAFTITAFSSIGLPGINGFIGEFLVLIGSFGRYPILVGVATTVVVFSAAIHAVGHAARVLQPHDQPAERGHRRPHPSRTRGAGPADRSRWSGSASTRSRCCAGPRARRAAMSRWCSRTCRRRSLQQAGVAGGGPADADRPEHTRWRDARPPARAGAHRVGPGRAARGGMAPQQRARLAPCVGRVVAGRLRAGAAGHDMAGMAGRTRRRPHADDRARRLPLCERRAAAVDRWCGRGVVVPLARAPGNSRARVLRAADARDRRDDAARRRGRPDHAVPRTRGDVGLGLRARRVRPHPPVVGRGGTQVLPDRRVRHRLPALRHRADLRRHRPVQPRPSSARSSRPPSRR